LEDLAGPDKAFFADYDLVGANLEGAVTDNGEHYPPVNLYDFAFRPDWVEDLRDYGFSYFTLANNHFSDQGQRGMEETRKHLSAMGLAFSGCQDRQVGDCSVTTMERNGKKIGLAGFSMVYGTFDLEEAKKQVTALAEVSDLVIVNVHWGTEYEHQFGRLQTSIGRAFVDAGADIIVGHHPHVVQGLETYRGRPIFYSLGNFIFDQMFSAATQEGLALDLVVDGDNLRRCYCPCRRSA
jgi:poly-gamma-glutamate capsule biosynthesis protein CapA/YwtB (metallophosphatase superfamily)